jgi:LL-H family phage holin
MRVFNEFLNEYGAKIIYLIVTMLIGYIGIVAKSLMQRIANDKTKKDIVAVCVKAVEQIYTDLHGDAKLRKCIDKVSDILRNKGIEVSEEEIYMLIESSVKDMNMAMKDVFYSQPETATLEVVKTPETELESVVETTDEVQE